MTTPVTKLKGMVDGLADKLKEKGISNNEQYLEAAASAKQRRALAKELDVAEKVILELANRADLARIKGVSGVYSDLLEQAGVDTVKELATRKSENLHAKIVSPKPQTARRSALVGNFTVVSKFLSSALSGWSGRGRDKKWEGGAAAPPDKSQYGDPL